MEHTGYEFGSYDIKNNEKEKVNEAERLMILLEGEYAVALSNNDRPENLCYEYKINLPSTLDSAGIGDINNTAVIDFLQRERVYIGGAFYKRRIVVPESWKGKHVILHMDRCMWESRVYIDGYIAGSCDSLSVPHVYDISDFVKPGEHELIIRVDNSGRDGAGCHGYGDQTQIKWNGILGKMYLSASDKVFIEKVRAYPDIKRNRVKAEIDLVNETGLYMDTNIHISVTEKATGRTVAENDSYIQFSSKNMSVAAFLDFTERAELWNEFNPFLYKINVSVSSKSRYDNYEASDSQSVIFGMREITRDDNFIYLNGEKIWLRGTHDGCCFPHTGEMSCDIEDWRRIFRTCREYGLNHVRYHSVCPSEQAFMAADEVGIYLQPELPFWGNVAKNWSGTAFLRNELIRILETYGNYASFILMSMGNEHSGDWEVLGEFVDYGKRQDPRHLYAASSNEYIRRDSKSVPGNPGDDFATNMWCMNPKDGSELKRIRYMERFCDWQELVEPSEDYDKELEGMDIPVIAHELGQWWIYPDFDEINKYTGVLKPSTLNIIKTLAAAKGKDKLNREYHYASGQLALQLYKEDIERQLRTKGMAGFQLLDLHDYPGQSCALVGILDVFWESKGLITPDKFKEFCNHTVVLARIESYTVTNNEKLRIPVEVYRYEMSDINDAYITFSFETSNNRCILSGSLNKFDVINRQNTYAGTIEADLSGLKEPAQLNLRICLEPAGFTNTYKIWVYPNENADSNYVNAVTAENIEAAEEAIYKGKNVLIDLYNSDAGKYVEFHPAVWTTNCKGRNSCGMLVNSMHPSLNLFPSENHSDWQFQKMMQFGKALILEETKDINIIASPIDVPVSSNTLAVLFECKCGGSTVIVSKLNLNNSIEGRQLKHSIMEYLNSETSSVSLEACGVERLKSIIMGNIIKRTDKMPENKAPLLNVICCGRMLENGVFPWNSNYDIINNSEKNNYSYELLDDDRAIKINYNQYSSVAFRADEKYGWKGSKFSIVLNLPENFKGELYLKLKSNSYRSAGFIEAFGEALSFDLKDGEEAYVMIKIEPKNIVNGKFAVNIGKMAYGYYDTSLTVTEMNLYK